MFKKLLLTTSMILCLTSATEAQQLGRHNIIVVVPPSRPIRTIPANRGMHAIPNRKYVKVPRRTGGGGFRYQTHGSPGKIKENPFYVLSKPTPARPKQRDELKAFYDLLERKLK